MPLFISLKEAEHKIFTHWAPATAVCQMLKAPLPYIKIGAQGKNYAFEQLLKLLFDQEYVISEWDPLLGIQCEWANWCPELDLLNYKEAIEQEMVLISEDSGLIDSAQQQMEHIEKLLIKRFGNNYRERSDTGPTYVRIKSGARIAQDHAFGLWPWVANGSKAEPNLIFEGVWDGKLWTCRRAGYGLIEKDPALRQATDYGNGAITVSSFDGVEIVSYAKYTLKVKVDTL